MGVFASVAWSADLTTQYGGGSVTGSVSYSTLVPAKVFDDLPATDVNGRWLSLGKTGWVQYQFPGGQSFLVGSYKLWNLTVHSVASRAPKDFNLAGSNDGTTWTVLDSRVGETGWTDAEPRLYFIGNPTTAYSHFRLTITANNGDTTYTGLSELELFEQAQDPPTAASAPSPADGAVDVYPKGTLRWTNGTGVMSNRVYMGQSQVLDETDLLGVTGSAELGYLALSGESEYFWRVDGVNPYGTTTGTVWRFTSDALPPEHVAYDGFEAYSTGPLAGDGTVGDGWTAPWTATTSAVQVVAASMRYAAGDVSVDGGDKAVSYPYLPGDTRPVFRTFDQIGYGPAYFSLLVRGSGMEVDVHSFALRDSSFDGRGDGIAESGGVNFGRGVSDSGPGYILAEVSYGDNARQRVATPVAPENNQTYFVVVRLLRSPTSNEYETVDVLVNPMSATEPATGWTTANSALCQAMGLRQFILRVAVMDVGDWLQFDELRIGTTYEAVVPKAIPSRSTLITVW